MMNIDAANNWPLMVVAIPGNSALQNDIAPPIFSRNHQPPEVLNNRRKIESDRFVEKGSVIDIYI
jgi:hypothetical protein